MKQQVNSVNMQPSTNRKELIKKMENYFAPYPGEDVFSEGGISDYMVKLFEKHSLARSYVNAYQQIIGSMLSLYQTNPTFTELINNDLPDGFDLSSIQLKLSKLSNFFESLEKDDSTIGCLEFRRLRDDEIIFKETELESIENELWNFFYLEEVEGPEI